MAELTFECPDCGYRGVLVEEICNHATLAYNVSVNHEGQYIQSDFAEIFDYSVDHYQCGSCGFVIKDAKSHCIDDIEDLAEWIKSQGTQGEGRDAQHAAGAE